MEDVFDKEENAKNIYVIKHKLGGLTRGPTENHFEWSIGHFVVKIYPKEIGDPGSPYLYLPQLPKKHSPADSILQYDRVDVHVTEFSPNDKGGTYINLNTDPRFRDYKPIQYHLVASNINLSDGRRMPILHLCELIRYLYRLSNLTAFL